MTNAAWAVRSVAKCHAASSRMARRCRDRPGRRGRENSGPAAGWASAGRSRGRNSGAPSFAGRLTTGSTSAAPVRRVVSRCAAPPDRWIRRPREQRFQRITPAGSGQGGRRPRSSAGARGRRALPVRLRAAHGHQRPRGPHPAAGERADHDARRLILLPRLAVTTARGPRPAARPAPAARSVAPREPASHRVLRLRTLWPDRPSGCSPPAPGTCS